MSDKPHHWSADVFREMKARKIDTVCTVPDGGLTQLLKMIEADGAMRLVTLTTEEEGIGIATGCWIGGRRPMIAMQSSGVGNCINALGLPAAYRAPCLMLVTMRGQWGEFNPWQVPMGQATQARARGRRRQVLPGRQGRARSARRSRRPPIWPSTAASARRCSSASASSAPRGSVRNERAIQQDQRGGRSWRTCLRSAATR